KQRVGTLDPKKLATMDLEPAFREKPAIHRFPGAMAARVHELAQVVATDYAGDASRIWTEAADAADLKKRLGSLPGFGPMKVTALGSVLALRFGLGTAKPLVPSHACLGAVDSREALAEYQAAKRARKAAAKSAANSA
ncbi:MAG: DNA repair protein, partial [Actinobacteria bacterium]|nr:DNA repair protein [Actinomycetota bacterium]